MDAISHKILSISSVTSIKWVYVCVFYVFVDGLKLPLPVVLNSPKLVLSKHARGFRRHLMLIFDKKLFFKY